MGPYGMLNVYLMPTAEEKLLAAYWKLTVAAALASIGTLWRCIGRLMAAGSTRQRNILIF
jgi:hypothetical protein